MPKKILICPRRYGKSTLAAEYRNEIAKLGDLKSAMMGDFTATAPKYMVHPGRDISDTAWMNFNALITLYGIDEKDCINADMADEVKGWREPEGMVHLFPFGIVRIGDFSPLYGQNGQNWKPVKFQQVDYL